MNRATHSTPSPRTGRTTAEQRAKLLVAFDRSGLSAAAFARKHQINYTTFCGWRQRRDRDGAACSPEFVQVELPASSESVSLIVEVGSEIRLRVSSIAHLELAAELLRRLRKEERC